MRIWEIGDRVRRGYTWRMVKKIQTSVKVPRRSKLGAIKNFPLNLSFIDEAL